MQTCAKLEWHHGAAAARASGWRRGLGRCPLHRAVPPCLYDGVFPGPHVVVAGNGQDPLELDGAARRRRRVGPSSRRPPALPSVTHVAAARASVKVRTVTSMVNNGWDLLGRPLGNHGPCLGLWAWSPSCRARSYNGPGLLPLADLLNGRGLWGDRPW